MSDTLVHDVYVPPCAASRRRGDCGPVKEHDLRIQLVAPREWADRVDEWRGRQPGVPNRSAAIRALVERGLEAERAEAAAARSAARKARR